MPLLRNSAPHRPLGTGCHGQLLQRRAEQFEQRSRTLCVAKNHHRCSDGQHRSDPPHPARHQHRCFERGWQTQFAGRDDGELCLPARHSSQAETTASRVFEDYTLSGASSLAELSDITGLKHLTIEDAAAISDFSSLSRFPYLESITIQDAPQLTDLSFVKSLQGLQSLTLKNTGVQDIAPLSGMKSLVSVTLENNRITDFTALGSVPYLKNAEIRAEEVTGLPELTGMRFLENFTVNGEQKK